LADILQRSQQRASQPNINVVQALANLGAEFLDKKSRDKILKEEEDNLKKVAGLEDQALSQFLSGGQPIPQADFQGRPVRGAGTVTPAPVQQPDPTRSPMQLGPEGTQDAANIIGNIANMGQNPQRSLPQMTPGQQVKFDAIKELTRVAPRSAVRAVIAQEKIERSRGTKPHQEIQLFEEATPWASTDRGTPQYEEAFLAFTRGKKLAQTINVNTAADKKIEKVAHLPEDMRGTFEDRYQEAGKSFTQYEVSSQMLDLLNSEEGEFEKGMFTGPLSKPLQAVTAALTAITSGQDEEVPRLLQDRIVGC
jgi:hypothetical protein